MDELYTIREVAEMLKISVSSMYRYVEEAGRFPHIKVGQNIRFRKDQIEAFLEQENQTKADQDNTFPLPTDLHEIYEMANSQ